MGDGGVAHLASDRKDFLLNATKVLFASLDDEGTLRKLADLVVPDVADWCTVHTLDASGAIGRVAVAHARPEWSSLAQEWQSRVPVTIEDASGVGAVIRTGVPTVTPEVTEEALARTGAKELADFARRIGLRSFLIVPLGVHGRTIGALVLAQTASGRRFAQSDLPFAQEIALRAGIALENARLYRGERMLRERMQRLAALAAALAAARTPEEVASAAAGQGVEAADAAAGAFVAFAPGAPLRVFTAVKSPSSWDAETLQGLVREARGGLPLYLPFAAELAARVPEAAGRTLPGSAWACLPLKEDGDTTGALIFAFDKRRGFPDEERAHLQALAEHVAQAYARARLHAELRAKEERFALVSQAVDEGLWEWDVAKENAWRSPSAETMFGYAVGELQGDDELWSAHIHPDDRERTAAELDALLRSPATRSSTQYRFRRKDGSYATVLDRCSIVRDERGAPLRLVGSMLDISRLKELEQAALVQKALLESQNEAALDGIFFQDENGRAVFYNRRLLEMWGVSADVPALLSLEERIGASLGALADPGSFAREALRLEGQRGETFRSDLLMKDGRIFDCYSAPVLDDAGAYRGRVWFYRDVTARRRAEEELGDARRQLAQSEKLAAMGALVSGVAHEVRTPLAYVNNHAELLASWMRHRAPRWLPAEELSRVGESTAAIAEGVDRMNRLVQDLRRFARLDVAGDAHVDDAAREALHLFEATHRGGVRVEAELAADAHARVDRVQLQQVILNLLENAAAASPRDAVVTLRTSVEDDAVVVRVRDKGAGIPPDVQARMWEPFFTTKSEGTGLGLSIVRRIAEQAGGSARCESGPGEGTLFEVRLAAAKP